MNRKRYRFFMKLFILLALIGVLLGIAVLITDLHVRSVTKNQILTNEQILSNSEASYDCILVLGCGIRSNGTPSLMLQERLDAAYHLYQNKISEFILVSGDNGKVDYNEVAVMKAYLVDKGVPDAAIYMDHAGFSTYESIYRAKEIFLADRIVVVTQKYHLARALYVAKARDIDAVGIPCDQAVYAGQTQREIREVFARVKDFWYCKFDLQPTYLGEKIPMEKE